MMAELVSDPDSNRGAPLVAPTSVENRSASEHVLARCVMALLLGIFRVGHALLAHLAHFSAALDAQRASRPSAGRARGGSLPIEVGQARAETFVGRFTAEVFIEQARQVRPPERVVHPAVRVGKPPDEQARAGGLVGAS